MNSASAARQDRPSVTRRGPFARGLVLALMTLGPVSAISVAGGAAASTPPFVAVAGFVLREGNSGVVQAKPQVTLSAPSSSPVSVTLATSNGTATAGSDYVARTATLVFQPGETLHTFTIDVLGDTAFESDESLFVTITDIVGGSIDPQKPFTSQSELRVLNDDPAPSQSAVTIEGSEVVEGNFGTRDAVFTVRLAPPSTDPVSMTFETLSGGTATPGVDFEQTAVGVAFAPGETVKQVIVPVIGDTRPEADETIRGVLTEATGGALITTAQAFVTIRDDDSALPSLSINDVTVTEAAQGPLSIAAFKLTLSSPASTAISVEVSTVNGSAAAITRSQKGDYVARTTVVTFPPGKRTQTFNVVVVDDNRVEGSETFGVNLSNAGGATIARPQGLGRILDND
ncbi:MAG: hypothetical protein C0434_09500 [Xanthomonadaceae bacterium]|nr:hypothetical protein [Xanthomonadaceae bacterium]